MKLPAFLAQQKSPLVQRVTGSIPSAGTTFLKSFYTLKKLQIKTQIKMLLAKREKKNLPAMCAEGGATHHLATSLHRTAPDHRQSEPLLPEIPVQQRTDLCVSGSQLCQLLQCTLVDLLQFSQFYVFLFRQNSKINSTLFIAQAKHFCIRVTFFDRGATVCE